MPDVTMKAHEVIGASEIVQRFLLMLSPLPAKQDAGVSARAGLVLRQIKRALLPAAEDVHEQLQKARDTASERASRGGRLDEAELRATLAAILQSDVTLQIPALLTRQDWDAIPATAQHTLPNLDANGHPVVTVLRKTEADLDTLGPLMSDPDTV